MAGVTREPQGTRVRGRDRSVKPQIAIIGAGISGLTAGYRLAKAGLKPIVFEKEPFVGGRMSTETVEGFVIDRGAYTIPEFHHATLQLIGEAGIERSLEETAGTSSTFCQGKEYAVKIGDPVDFLRYKLLSFRNKRDMVRLFLYATSLGKALDVHRPSERTFELERETAAEYLLREYDEEILEKVAYPIFCEIFLGTPERNSKLAFLATLPNLTRFKILSLREGVGRLPEALAQHLEVRLRCPVLQIRGTEEGKGYEVQTGGERPESLPFDLVVFALPAPHLAVLFEEFPASLKASIGQIEHAPSLVVAFALDQPFPKASFINNLLRKDFRHLGTLVFSEHKGRDQVPPGKGLVTAVLREEASRKMFRSAEQDISKVVLGEIDLVFPSLSRRVLFSRVYRWPQGAVQLRPGTVRHQGSIREAWEACFPDLYLASDDLCRSSIETQVRTGIRVAEQILKRYS